MVQELAIVRAAHVLGVVIWIGGVVFVTTVLLPGLAADYAPARRLQAFHRLEGRFAWVARACVAVVGVTGFWMVHRLALWSRFSDPTAWWLHAMVGVWTLFALILFMAEPLVLHRRMAQSRDPARAFRRLAVMHWALLAVSLIAIFGAVAGAHGL
ncbi:CopD family protein [Caulobacter segnis]|uniref:CopD family protein n=1 Tax=Caulobacter segnis TaxID=88688 RepID=UPI001CC087BC|nr:CopD family protein [Caulobacter segnis]